MIIRLPACSKRNVMQADLKRPAKAPKLEQAMQGHVLERCELIGTYQKS